MSPIDPNKPTDPHSPPDTGTDDLPTLDLGSEAQIDLGDLAVDAGASAAIPLADLPESPSGQSLTSWTEVIRRQQELAKMASKSSEGTPVVDAPSDADLLARLAREDSPRSGDTSEIPEAEIPVFGGDEDVFPARRSASEIDLGSSIPAGQGHSASQIGFDVLHPPSDAAGAMPLPPAQDLPPLVAADFSDADLPFSPEDDGSSAQLGQLTPSGSVEDRSSILDVLLNESSSSRNSGSKIEASDVWDFGQTPLPTNPPMDAPIRSANRPPSSAENFGIPPIPQSTSNWDTEAPEELGELIPESKSGVDAVVDLYSDAAVAPPSITDSGSLAISDEIVAEARRQALNIESSSVDLSSRPSLSETDFDAMVAPSKYGNDDEGIDLDIPEVTEAASSSMVYRRNDGLADNQRAIAAEFERRRRDSDPAMVRPETTSRGSSTIRPVITEPSASTNKLQYMLRGTALGLLLGGGGAIAGVYAGLFKSPADSAPSAVVDNSAELTQLKKQLAETQVAASAAEGVKKALAGAGINGAPETAIASLIDERGKLDSQAKQLSTEVERTKTMLTAAQKAAEDARAAELTAQSAAKKANDDLQALKASSASALKDVETAKKAAEDAKNMLGDAMKAADAAKQDSIAAKKQADDIKAMAEAKEKEANDKLAIAVKKADDLAKVVDSAKAAVDTAQKAADEAKKARDASDSVLAKLTDRLAAAKFVSPKADATALLKGIDDALKAASTDATAALRDELAKARETEAKAKTDLSAAQAKEAAATKLADAAKADVAKLTADAKLANDKLAAELQRVAKLSKDAADAMARGDASAKAAAEAKAIADKATADLAKLKADADAAIKASEQATTQLASAKQEAERARAESLKLKAEKDRLTAELDTLKDIAAAVRAGTAPTANISAVKPDVTRIAERAFGDGLRAYLAGQTTEALSSLRRAIQFQPDDARYHYLLGAALWNSGDRAEAEAELKKAQDLEATGRPGSKSVSAALEKIQGPARQVINSYRP